MQLQQLRFLVTVCQTGFNVTEASRLLHTSQPGVSRQLKMLECELGVQLLERTSNRIIGLAPGAQPFLDLANRIVEDAERLKAMASRPNRYERKSLTLATTHSLARYLLPKPIGAFREAYPSLTVSVINSTPEMSLGQVADGEAEIAINTKAFDASSRFISIPCYQLRRILIMPKGHHLKTKDAVTLSDIASYPLVAYASSHAGRASAEKAFKSQNIPFNIAVTAADADIVKTCVADGLGIAVISSISFQPSQDMSICAIPVDHLFEPSIVYATLERRGLNDDVLLAFINEFSPHLTFNTLKSLSTGHALPSPATI